MSLRTKKGLRWLRWVVIVIGVWAAAKIIFTILGSSDSSFIINNVAASLVGFLVGSLIFGALAFVLGWLVGGKEKIDDN